MKKNYFVAILALICTFATAQIEQTSYRGAFAPAPTAMWTDGWANFDPQNAAYPAVNVTISSDITANTTWTTGNTYALSGLIYVRNNATLTIQPGVVIKGAGAGAALIVTKGAKLDAVGTATSPIVFTSNQPAGSRQKGDWGGIILLGKGSFNLNNGVNNIEGITATAYTEYGGGLTPDDNDNSGTLKYVRIEFCGYAYSPNNEINGLTMGAVGRGTTIDYVQVSHCNDDAFEWFGGTVNCKHLVSYRNLDDDFDTDNGYSGMVQYALAVRDPQVADAPAVSTSEGFESDNNAGGTAVSPYTSAIFTNCTLIGPSYRTTLPNGGTLADGYKRVARIRRASQLKIFNSLFMDFLEGVHIDGLASETSALDGTLKFKNNILAGIVTTSKVYQVNATGNNPSFNIANWYTASGNSTVASNSGLLTAPYNNSDAAVYTGLDYRPASGSIVESGADFSDTAFAGKLVAAPVVTDIEYTSYRGAFAPAPTAMWTDNWTNYDPQNTNYPTTGITVSSDITTNTTWTTGNTYLLQGLTYVKNGATLTIQPGVIIRGAVSTAALVVTKGAKLDAVGTATSPIVFTSNQPVGSRQKGDWGGIVLLGKASFNLNNGVNNIEGITATDDTQYGGGLTPDDNDNSGTLKYVRIEFCGYAYSPNNEINGLTMGAVGRGTTIDYVQVSYCNDDAFEWFGGTVNCKHLVSYRNLDDDFDTDNGYSGKVQYALAVRDPQIADDPAVSTSEGFESDNNASGTAVSPYTSAIFTNCTLIGPSYRVSTLPNGGPLATGYERAARIRRASKLNILNSIFMDFKKGIHIDGTLTENNAIAGDLKFKNNILAGITDQTNVTMVNGGSTFGIAAWFTANGNTNVATNAGILTAPYNTSDATVYTGLDYRPATGSIALSGSNFAGLIAAVPPTVVSPVAVCKGDKTTVLSATLAGGTSLKWYTAATGGKATTVAPKLATTTAGSTKSYWVSQVLPDGSESARAEIVVTVNDLPAKAGAITGNTKPSQFVGTTDELTYSIAEVAGATSYNWVAPLGMNIVSGQGTNEIIVDLNDVPAGAGIIGSLSVQAVNEAGCPSTAKVLKLTKVLPASPGTLSMTDGPASVTVEGVTTKAKAITTFGQFIGQDKELTLTAKPVVGATSYEWELPEGVNQVSGGTTNVITVNFAGVTPVTTTALYIGVKAKNGTGVSVTKNTTKVPETSSTAKLLLLKAAAPVSPSALKMFDDAISTTKAVTVISKYIGTATPLRLQAKPVATAYAYEWELPAGVTQLSGGTSNEITVDFAGVPAGTASLYIGVKAVNGVGVSTKSNATKVPATSSTATLLLLKATVPATVKAVTGQIVGLCGTYDYTITPTVLANGYTIVAPEGSVVTSASNPTNDSNVLTNTADLTFTVQYPDGMVADKLNPKTLTVISVNGVGNSLNGKVLKLSTELAAVGAPTGGTTFQRCSTMTFSVPAVAFATNYVWSATNGAVFVGDATSNSVEVDFSEVPAGLTKTTLSVQASTDCGYIGKAKVISLKSVACGTGRMAPAAVTAAVTSAEIYPNPAVDSFNLDITAERNGELTITICSFNGNEIYSRKVGLTEGLNTVTENISSLGKGIYFVKIYNSANNQTLVKKLVKN